jgi:hypothetical protein
MDDIFSILIYLFIIISFLSQIFKKKKPQGPPQQESRVPQDRVPGDILVEDEPGSSAANPEYDIMREIENMFKNEEEKIREAEQSRKSKIEEAARRSPKKIPSERISYEDYVASEQATFEADKSKATRDYSESRVDRSEHTYASHKRKPKKVDSKIEEQARRFQEMLDRKTQHDQSTSELVRKIRDPRTFREYILVSEILARPKILRR